MSRMAVYNFAFAESKTLSSATTSQRIVIFTSTTSPYAPVILRYVVQQYREQIQAIITIDSGSVTSKLRKIRSVIKKAGVRYAILKLILFGTIKLWQTMSRYPTIISLCHQYQIRHKVFSSLKTSESIAILREMTPDIIISVLFEKMIPEEIIGLPKKAALNIHPAPLPRYAGVAPTFWVLSGGEKKTAVTIHYLDNEFDTGDVALQEEIGIPSGISVHSLYLRCCEIAGQMIVEVFRRSESATLSHTKQDATRRTYFSSPTKEGYSALLRNRHSLFSIKHLFRPLEQ